MFIQTEATPNPSTLKFIPGQTVLASGVREFTNSDDAVKLSPLAERLFAVSGVSGVFLGSDFIAVTKSDAGDWQQMKPAVLGAIMEHYLSGDAALSSGDEAAEQGSDDFAPEDAQAVATIKELIETRVRPAVANDGGDIVFHGFRDGVVFLKMRGACAGCPSSTATLRYGIENLLKHYVPEVEQVQAV